MRPWLVAGNWKMHTVASEAVNLARGIAEATSGVKGGDVVIAPPFTSLVPVSQAIKGTHVKLAAQNLYFQDKGAFTGEVAPLMLVDAGCEYVIIGHSERRKYFGETDESVSLKVLKALSSGLKPIVCVGESEEEQEKGVTQFVVGMQVRKALFGLAGLTAVTVAYEPVWAIGTGKNATPAQAQEVHGFIRGLLAEMFGNEAEATRILYGGSVTADNVADLAAMKDIDGALVGGASLKSDSFSSIISTVAERRTA